MSNYLAIAALLMTIATPALAAEYSIVQDPTTKNCEVTSKKPDGQVIGTYPTKKEAKAAKEAKQAAGECKAGATDG